MLKQYAMHQVAGAEEGPPARPDFTGPGPHPIARLPRREHVCVNRCSCLWLSMLNLSKSLQSSGH